MKCVKTNLLGFMVAGLFFFFFVLFCLDLIHSVVTANKCNTLRPALLITEVGLPGPKWSCQRDLHKREAVKAREAVTPFGWLCLESSDGCGLEPELLEILFIFKNNNY